MDECMERGCNLGPIEVKSITILLYRISYLFGVYNNITVNTAIICYIGYTCVPIVGTHYIIPRHIIVYLTITYLGTVFNDWPTWASENTPRQILLWILYCSSGWSLKIYFWNRNKKYIPTINIMWRVIASLTVRVITYTGNIITIKRNFNYFVYNNCSDTRVLWKRIIRVSLLTYV